MMNVNQPFVASAEGTAIKPPTTAASHWAALPTQATADTVFKIQVASHFFKVTPLTDIARKICFEFCKRYTLVETQGTEITNTVYAAADLNRTWFRFHINTLKDWKNFIYQRGYAKAAVYETKPAYKPTKVSLALKDGWTHKPEQEPVRDYLAMPIGIKDEDSGLYPEGTGSLARLVGISTGAGKSQPLHSKIKTPFGWKTMGEVRVGDIITAWDGADTKIVGIYPQGVRDVVTVTFEDGRTAQCDREHLWKVYKASGEWFIKTIDEILRDREYARTEYYIDYRIPTSLEAKVIANRFKDKVGPYIRGKFDCKADEVENIVDQVRALGGFAKVEQHSFLKDFKVIDFDLKPAKKLKMVDIKASGKEHCQCIEVDHPDRLYVTDNFVVTHNTFCALAELARRGEVFVVVVLAQFVEKWVKDISNTLKVNKKEILAVQGSSALKALTEMAVTKGAMKPYKAIVISNRTYENFLRAFERHEKEMQDHGYMCPPDELFEKLGVGTRLVDEVHMQFYANYRLDLYTHVPQSISLSATLISKDPGKERIHQTAYPMAERYKEGPIKKFTNAYAIRYSVTPQWRYKTSYGTPNYSQNAYEESILKNKRFTESYCKMIKTYMDIGYRRNYQPGNKAIVFCGTVAMCGELAKYLQNCYPDLDVKRYVAEDPYEENYKKPDIRVTTIGSGGTGHDVPGLTDGHLTNGIESIQANIQAFGRLRYNPEKQTRFFFYTNTDIPKQLKYDRSKMQLMRERAKSITPLSYGELG